MYTPFSRLRNCIEKQLHSCAIRQLYLCLASTPLHSTPWTLVGRSNCNWRNERIGKKKQLNFMKYFLLVNICFRYSGRRLFIFTYKMNCIDSAWLCWLQDIPWARHCMQCIVECTMGTVTNSLLLMKICIPQILCAQVTRELLHNNCRFTVILLWISIAGRNFKGYRKAHITAPIGESTFCLCIHSIYLRIHETEVQEVINIFFIAENSF